MRRRFERENELLTRASISPAPTGYRFATERDHGAAVMVVMAHVGGSLA
ncbi:MAG: hypothetical protein IPO90_12940 [Flavobacteriales bacterium]|nr:hypothetical protein [Flavobacteriales bacterium]